MCRLEVTLTMGRMKQDTWDYMGMPAPTSARLHPAASKITVPARAIVIGLSASLLLLLVLNLLVVWMYVRGVSFPGRGRFYFDNENNLPTFFSTLMLLLASLLAAAITVQARAAGELFVRHWGALALILLAMATEEAASFHEGLVVPLRRVLDLSDLGGPLLFAWVLVGMPVVVIFGAAYLRFVVHLPPRTRSYFMSAAAVYVAGAIGFEMVGATLFSDEVRAVVEYGAKADRRILTYMLVMTAEETLEMAGVLLGIAGLLFHLRERQCETIVRVN